MSKPQRHEGHEGRTAVYTTREGRRIRLVAVEPVRFAPGFYYGNEEDTGRLLQVHEHRLVFELNQEGNPS